MLLSIKSVIYPEICSQAVILLKSIEGDLKEYLSVFGDINNPIFISILVAFLVILFLYFTIKYVVIPLKRQHAIEENELKLQNARLMALFADLDPDPLIRLNLEGKVIVINPAARECGLGNLMGKKLSSFFPDIQLNYDDFIKGDSSVSYLETYLDKYYELQMFGINNLGIAQVYFHDITELTLNQKALEKSQHELKEFSKNLQMKIEEERQRISTELHDDVGQNLLLLRLNLQRRFVELTGGE
jgi:signal transduction histidine kinase